MVTLQFLAKGKKHGSMITQTINEIFQFLKIGKEQESMSCS